MSEKYVSQVEAWKELVLVVHLALEIDRQVTALSWDFDRTDFGKIHCLQDLIMTVEALLVDVPEPERHGSAVHAVRSAYRAVFPQIPCPPLADGFADAFRPHWDSADFWNMVCRKLG
jgi:hypothetical protein